MENTGYTGISDEFLAETLWSFDFDVVDSFSDIESKQRFFDELISLLFKDEVLNRINSKMNEAEREAFLDLFLNCIKLAFEICASAELLLNREKDKVVIKLVSSFVILDKEKMMLLKQICEKASQIEIITLGVKNLDLEMVINFFLKN